MSAKSSYRNQNAPAIDGGSLLAAEAWSLAPHAPVAHRLEAQPRDAAPESPLTAPARLLAETRITFRREALAYVDEAAREGRSGVDIDLGQTVEIDAGGLGLLVLVQRRARTHGLSTRLLHPREQVRRLLALTKLDYLFEFVD